jgi:cytochrome P450
VDLWQAGMETSALTLRWAVLLLVAYPDVQAKMQAEIDAVIGKDRLPCMADKPNMPYTTAVIMEAQRWSNILNINVSHKTTQDTEIAGQ